MGSLWTALLISFLLLLAYYYMILGSWSLSYSSDLIWIHSCNRDNIQPHPQV